MTILSFLKNNFRQFNRKLFFYIFVFHLFCINQTVVGQKYTISGFIDDASSGESMISGTVYDELSKQGVVSNVYGFYSLSLPAGPVKIAFSYVGYQTQIFEFNLQKDTTIKVNLQPSVLLNEVVITSKRESQVDNAQMSVVEIPISTIKSLPVFMGEKDILKAIQLFPGVQSGGEGTSGLYVRGGGPDQNLILLDGVPVYNADHLFGFFSVFNPDAIQHVSLIKGGFPARYGGRLSSVLDIRMKEGNNKEFQGEFSVGLIASKITVEGPIIKNKSSFVISARRTYIDLLAKPFIKSFNESTSGGYYFYDLNTKLNYIISEKDRVFLSLYTGQDKAYMKFKESYYYDDTQYNSTGKAGLDWGNITTALRWNHVYTNKLFSNVTATFSRFRFDISEQFINSETTNGVTETSDYKFSYFSGIHDWAIKADFEYHPSPGHRILAGVSDIYHTFSPGSTIFKFNDAVDDSYDIEATYGNNRVFAHESALYVEDELDVTPTLKINSGLHFSVFNVHGTTYQSLQPRLNVRYIIKENWSAKASFSRMNQYILLLTNSGIGLPTDLWLPATKDIKPQESWQIAGGIFHDLKNGLEVSVEGFYKTMENLIEYKEGADFFSISMTWEEKIETGKGNAYGAEVLIRKQEGKTTGWIGYTLSWANRQFENLNFGEPFPYRYDRRHDIGLAITHNVNENIDFGLVWVFGTGNAVSLPIEKYPSAGLVNNWNYGEIQYYDGRNGFRTPSYHRLDLGVNLHKKLKKGERTWSFNIYNVYNRKNPFMIYFGSDNYGNSRLKQLSLFPMIPSFSYSFKF